MFQMLSLLAVGALLTVGTTNSTPIQSRGASHPSAASHGSCTVIETQQTLEAREDPVLESGSPLLPSHSLASALNADPAAVPVGFRLFEEAIVLPDACGSEDTSHEELSTDHMFAPVPRPDLIVESVSHADILYSDGTASVLLRLKVKNIGNATAYGFTCGGKGWGFATIASCTGNWRSINTTTTYAPGQSKTVYVYGPGWVGPRVTQGSAFSVTTRADTHCSIQESNESNNARTAVIQVWD